MDFRHHQTFGVQADLGRVIAFARLLLSSSAMVWLCATTYSTCPLFSRRQTLTL